MHRHAQNSAVLRLLVVEDHAATAHALRAVLARAGHVVTVAGSVADALRQARGAAFDLLISDLGLPDGDGHELMKRLREFSDIPGIAMSGFGMVEDIRRSREAGFAAHLIKPVEGRRLCAAVEDLWARLHRSGKPLR